MNLSEDFKSRGRKPVECYIKYDEELELHVLTLPMFGNIEDQIVYGSKNRNTAKALVRDHLKLQHKFRMFYEQAAELKSR